MVIGGVEDEDEVIVEGGLGKRLGGVAVSVEDLDVR